MSDVYFISSKADGNKSLIKKFENLISKISLDFIKPNTDVAIKLHMGHKNNTAYLRPIYARVLASIVKEKKARPFLTDTVTLYHGARNNAVDFISTCVENGFSFDTIGSPIIIADGIKSKDVVNKEINLKHFKTIKIASAAYYADSILTLTHFKPHMAMGFGGAIKNIGMGLVNKSMKQQLHASVKPKIFKKDLCDSCGICVKVCPEGAVVLNTTPEFDYSICIGCAECITSCPHGTLEIEWNESPENLGEKTSEACYSVMADKKGKIVFYNFLIDITPDCDCCAWSDNSIVPNIGILASIDPVAIDAASIDLVNNEIGLPNTRIKKAHEKGADKFKDLHPEIDWKKCLEYAEHIGLGKIKYNLIRI